MALIPQDGTLVKWLMYKINYNKGTREKKQLKLFMQTEALHFVMDNTEFVLIQYNLFSEISIEHTECMQARFLIS